MQAEPEQPKRPEEPSDAQSKGWLDDLGERSSGVEKHVTPLTPSSADDNTGWKKAAVPIQFVLTVSVMAYLGYKLDQKMGWEFGGLVTLTLIGLIGSTYLLIKESLRQDARNEKQKQSRPKAQDASKPKDDSQSPPAK